MKNWQMPPFIEVNSNVIFSFKMTTCNSDNRQNAIGTGLEPAQKQGRLLLILTFV
jgi:hypothetical protein